MPPDDGSRSIPTVRAIPRTRITLASCRENLRAAVRLLSQNQPTPNPRERGPEPESEPRHGQPSPDTLREFRLVEEAYDELVTLIGHEVKTSLTVIRGHAQLTARALRRGQPLDPDALMATLALIDASTARAARQLDDLIDDIRSNPPAADADTQTGA